MYESFKTDDPNELCGSIKTKLNRKPKICKDIDDTSRIPIAAATGLGTTEALQFIYKGSPKTYVDLNDSEIYLHCVLTHQDGTPLDPGTTTPPKRPAEGDEMGVICGIGTHFFV